GRQLDDDVAMPVQRGPRARRHHARGIVLFDDARTNYAPLTLPRPGRSERPRVTRGAPRQQISAIDDARLAPAETRAQGHEARPAGAARARAIDAQRVGHARPVGNALTDDAPAHDLDRFFGAGAMAVRPLVLAAERFVQPGQRAGFDRAAGHRYGQLERLAFVAAIRRAPDPHGGAGEPLGRELSARLGLHPPEHIGERRRLDAARPP